MEQRIEPELTWPEDPRQALLEHVQAMTRFMDSASRDVSLAVAQARRRDPRIVAASRQIYDESSRHYVEALLKASGGKSPWNFCALLAESLIGALINRLVVNNEEVAEAELIELVEQAVRSAEAGPGPNWPGGRSFADG